MVSSFHKDFVQISIEPTVTNFFTNLMEKVVEDEDHIRALVVTQASVDKPEEGRLQSEEERRAQLEEEERRVQLEEREREREERRHSKRITPNKRKAISMPASQPVKRTKMDSRGPPNKPDLDHMDIDIMEIKGEKMVKIKDFIDLTQDASRHIIE